MAFFSECTPHLNFHVRYIKGTVWWKAFEMSNLYERFWYDRRHMKLQMKYIIKTSHTDLTFERLFTKLLLIVENFQSLLSQFKLTNNDTVVCKVLFTVSMFVSNLTLTANYYYFLLYIHLIYTKYWSLNKIT